jgi:PleD family two-component response regulator
VPPWVIFNAYLHLTLVKSFVMIRDGLIGVSSEGDNRGSNFSIRYPVATLAENEPTLSSTRTPEIPRLSQRKRRRVLIVDDNNAAAKTLSTDLKMLGHDVRVAGDGREGCETAANFRPEVIFMDIGMLQMNGYETA